MNRNGTVEPNEWEAGIVKAKYKVYLCLTRLGLIKMTRPDFPGI